MKFKHCTQISPNEWALYFVTNTETFDSVYNWFTQTLIHETDFMAAWRSDRTSLTVFIRNEQALIISLLRWT